MNTVLHIYIRQFKCSFFPTNGNTLYFIGVFQLINKTNGRSFDENDESLFEVLTNLTSKLQYFLKHDKNYDDIAKYSYIAYSTVILIHCTGVHDILWNRNPQHEHV